MYFEFLITYIDVGFINIICVLLKWFESHVDSTVNEDVLLITG